MPRQIDPKGNGTYCPHRCTEVIKTNEPVEEKCCKNRNISLKNGLFVCINCGLVHGLDFEPYKFMIDFHENLHKVRRKSVYQGKYHVEMVIYNSNDETRIQI